MGIDLHNLERLESLLQRSLVFSDAVDAILKR